MKKTTFFILAILTLFSSPALCYFPINVFRPWDINLRPPQWDGCPWQVTAYVERGYKVRAADGKNRGGNPLHIWQDKQDALAMLKGFSDTSPMTLLLNDIEAATGGMLSEDGARGNFDVTGDFHFTAGFGLFARYHFQHNFTLGFYVPFYAMHLNNIKFRDLTSSSNVDISDVAVKEELTDHFCAKVAQLDPSLDLLSGWDRTGLGDMTILAEWQRDFPQAKKILRNVTLDIRAGLTLPTGVKQEEDSIFSIPFGNDGAAGIIIGGGIEVSWFDRIHGGIDFEFLQLFGSTRIRRIKTHVDQTDLLLLAKERVNRDFGFVQRYDLSVEFDPIVSGLSGSLIYQFFKHSKDTLALTSLNYSNIAANTAQSLKEWTMHHIIAKVAYDFQYMLDEYSDFRPQVMAFCKVPFNGKRAILVNTYGFEFSLNF